VRLFVLRDSYQDMALAISNSATPSSPLGAGVSAAKAGSFFGIIYEMPESIS
jgi:hypothetical protein